MKHRVYYLVSRSLKEVFKDAAPGINLAISRHTISYPKPDFGDYASNVSLIVAKMYPQLAPGGAAKLAEALADSMQQFDTEVEFEKIEAVNGFINFTLSKDYLVSKLSHILSLKERYGESNIGENETVVVEYLSPNTNKPLHLGHIRNGVLGTALSKMLSLQAHLNIKTSIINDRGIHICKSMLAWQKWGNGITPESSGKKGDHFVGDWYVRFSQEHDKDPSLLDEAQEMLRKWEQGDAEVMALWKQMREWVLQGFKETYDTFGFTFDKEYFESEVYEQGKDLVEAGVRQNIFQINEKGNTVYNLPDSFGKDENGQNRLVTVLRPDGTSLYVTQDIGLAVRRQGEYKFGRLVYVVGSEQNFHFQTLFAILQAFGYEWAKKLFHLSYGMVYLPEGKMKSREGTVVDADDLLVQMKELAKEEIQKRLDGSLDEAVMEKRSTDIALAAIKFYFLRNRPTTDIYFDPKESIAFEGFTGPYLQYTHARIYGILRKHGDKALEHGIGSMKYGHNLETSEMIVLRKLHQFPEALEAAAAEYLPSMLCKYLFEVAQDFNSFYQNVPVLNEKNQEIRDFRLRLIMATAQVLKNGLTILGIEAPEEM